MLISCFSFTEVSKEASKVMKEGGSLLTLTYESTKAIPNYNVMGVCKSALEASVKYLARDLGSKKIRVNAISAGPIKTLAAAGISGFNEILNIVNQRSALKRNITAEEVVNEISDKMKVDYIKKAKKQITDLEKAGASASGKYNTDAGNENLKRRKGIRMATGKLMSSESTMPSKVGTAIKTYGIAKNPKVFLAKKVIGGTANLASKISNRIQARRNARNMTPPPASKPTPIKSGLLFLAMMSLLLSLICMAAMA